MMKSWLRFAYLLPITLFWLLSFREFAPITATSINSDRAIHVLMAYDFRIPDDLYFWGQDRLGSLVPLLAHGLVMLGLTPAMAVSIVHYGLLAVGVACLASLLTSPLHQMILALAWLLPSLAFKAVAAISQPYGPQFALIGLAIVAVRPLLAWRQPIGHWSRLGWLTLFTLAGFGSLWMSELSIVPIGLVAIILGLHYVQCIQAQNIQAQDRASSKPAWNMVFREWGTVLGCSLLGIAFLGWAKASASGSSKGLVQALSWSEVMEVNLSLIGSLFNTLRFNNLQYLGYNQFRNVSHSLAAWLAVLLVLYVLGRFTIDRIKQTSSTSTSQAHRVAKITQFKTWQIKTWQNIAHQVWAWYQQTALQTRWLMVFGASTLVSLGLLVSSRWVYENNVSLRYFAFIYLCGWMTGLLLAEHPQWRSPQMSAWLVAIAVCFSLSLPRATFSFQPQISHLDRLTALEPLGQAGFIGDYWHSYHLCVGNPAQLKCSARQQGERDGENWPGVRCNRCVDQVLQSPVIYLVNRNWLDEFPEEIWQFDHRLEKIGAPIRIEGYKMAPYRLADPADPGVD